MNATSTSTFATTTAITQDTPKEVITDNQTNPKVNPESEAEEFITSPLRAIRMKCIDCCGGQISEVRLCPCKQCVLWPYRMASNPFRTRTMTDEQREAARDRLAMARAAKRIGNVNA